jgi:hypothetical protein
MYHLRWTGFATGSVKKKKNKKVLQRVAKSDTFRVVNRRVGPHEGRILPSFMGKTKEKQT